jgi:hypothetical protein
MSKSRQICPKCNLEFPTQRSEGSKADYHRLLESRKKDNRLLAGALMLLKQNGITVGSKDLLEAARLAEKPATEGGK